jgi:hypothetical protein
MKEITCNDCGNCGEIYAPITENEDEPMQKYCPPEYLWNHPNAEKCPNFVQKEIR